MIDVATRKRTQPAPPRVVFEALTQPHRDPLRPWLVLAADEQEPAVVAAEPADHVVWSSLWRAWPSAQIRFDLPSDGSYGTDLRWTLAVDPPVPDDAEIAHMRRRINELINANLRLTFGH